MTTAHRATWHPAVALGAKGGYLGKSGIVSVKDLNSHTVLKYRKRGQNAVEDIRSRDLKEELLDKEQAISGANELQKVREGLLPSNRLTDETTTTTHDEDFLDDAPTQALKLSDVDFSQFDDSDDSDIDSDEESDEESESDDDDELLRQEIEKIKKEEELQRIKQEELDKEDELQLAGDEAILASNPLIGSKFGVTSNAVKRKWYDDSIFSNTTKQAPQDKKKLINDTLRSDFHKSFMKKYFK